MARISAYKFVSPIAGGSNKSPTVAAASRNLVALNNIGFSLTGIANTVNDLHKISLLTVKNDKLREIAERRRAQREKDRLAEEELENRKILRGSASVYKKQGEKGLNKLKRAPWVDKLLDGIFGPFKGLVTALLAFVGKIFAFAVTRELMVFVANPENKKQMITFLERTAFVIRKLYDFTKWLVKDKFLDGFASLTGEGNTFGERLKGLGDLLIGITTLGALLNPFGLIDGILRLLGMDFYRPDPGAVDGYHTSNVKNKNIKTIKNKNIKNRSISNKVNYNTKAGSTFKLEATRKLNMMNKLAPEGFRWDAKANKYVSKGPALINANQPKGNITSKGITRIPQRGLIKLLGKNGAATVKNIFKGFGQRIPWMGGLFTAIYSMMNGDPIGMTLFKSLGSLAGGALGTFLPIPFLGSILGMYAGEYVGELLYMGFNGSSPGQIAEKVKADFVAAYKTALRGGQMALNWIGGTFKRFYAGIPKWKIPEFPGWAKWADFLNIGGREIPDLLWLASGAVGNLAPLKMLLKAAFSSDPIPKGSMKKYTLPNFNRDGEGSPGTAGRRQEMVDKRVAAANALTMLYSDKKKYKANQIVYKPGFMGYNKKYYIFDGFGIGAVSMANPLTAKNFRTDAEYEAFQAAGGTQRLLQGGITPEQMVTKGKKLLAKANVVATPTVNDTTKKEGTYKDGVQVINGEVVEVKNGEIVKEPIPGPEGDGTYEQGYNDGYRAGVNETAAGIQATNDMQTDNAINATKSVLSSMDPRDIPPDHSILEKGFLSPTFKNKNKPSTFNLSYANMPFVPNSEYKGVETDNKRYGNTMPEGAFGIGSKSTDSKKKAWWDPLGVFTGKSIGGLVPARLKGASTGKSFFFGKIFRGISKAVGGVFNGIKKAVTGIVQSPIFNIASTILSFTPLAPIVAGVQAVAGLVSGNPMQMLSSAFSLGSTFFPQTFSNITSGINNTFGKVLGGGINGFLSGGIQGAMGGLMGGIQGMLPAGVQNFFGRVGGFIEKFPSVGGLISMIPGVANIPGLAGLFGLQDFGGVQFNPMNMFQDMANNFGLGGLFRSITGMMQGEGGFMDGMIDMAAELGVNPSVLGVSRPLGSTLGRNMADSSREYAMQTSLEFIPIPVIIEKLTPIPKPVPINTPVPVKQPAPPQQQQKK